MKCYIYVRGILGISGIINIGYGDNIIFPRIGETIEYTNINEKVSNIGWHIRKTIENIIYSYNKNKDEDEEEFIRNINIFVS